MISETNKGNDSNLELYGFTSVCILTLPVEILESVHWHTNRAPHNAKLRAISPESDWKFRLKLTLL